MAFADYYLCDLCGGKTFYDSNLSYWDERMDAETGHRVPDGRVGHMRAICTECAKTHRLEIVPRSEGEPTPLVVTSAEYYRKGSKLTC